MNYVIISNNKIGPFCLKLLRFEIVKVVLYVLQRMSLIKMLYNE